MNRRLYRLAKENMTFSFMISVITNNLANFKTHLYKKELAEISNIFYQPFVRKAVDGTPIISSCGKYEDRSNEIQDAYRLNNGGSLYKTGQELHIAIRGDGYFQIEMPNGNVAYTRIGNFILNDQGQIVTHEGFPLLPLTTISSDAKKIIIDENGNISVILPNVAQPQILSQINLANFINKNGLTLLSRDLYAESEASGPAINGIASQGGFGVLVQRWLEETNASLILEIKKLIELHRLGRSKPSSNCQYSDMAKVDEVDIFSPSGNYLCRAAETQNISK